MRQQSEGAAFSRSTPEQQVAARPDREASAAGPPPPAIRISVRHASRLEKMQVFLFAPLPAPGVSTIFEALCRQYSPQKALQMILRRALDDYEELLESGAFQKTPICYPCEDTGQASVIQTSRMIPNTLVAIARAHFDPLGMESTRSFGRKLATAALAAFFLGEGKRHE